MSKIEIKVPDLGGSADVDVIELCVAPGDQVAIDDALIVLESDKATMEIPSTAAGTIVEFKVAVGDKVSEGHVILILEAAETVPVKVAPATAESVPVEPVKVESRPAVESRGVAAPTQPSAPVLSIVKVPDIGSDSAVVIELCVSVGDVVAVDESLVVLESDKATMEVPSTLAGKVTRVLLKAGEKVSEGADVVELEVTSSNVAATSNAEVTPPAVNPPPQKVPEVAKAVAAADTGSAYHVNEAAGKVHAGPAVRKLAREFGVDLTQVVGTAPKNRIVKEDVQAYVKMRMQQSSPVAAVGSGIPAVKLPDFSQFGEIDRRPMSKIGKITAENMHRAWLNVPHVTQFEEADITELEAFRKGQKALADAKGLRLTPMPFLLKACAYALQAMPQFNVSLDMETNEIVQKHYVHIGMAVDTPDGLVVPVIRDVDKKSLWDLARETTDLAAKAKDKKLMPKEMQGGCFTISSLGSVGGTAFTPIVNTPEVAILGVSKASIKPVYDGKQFMPRLMLPLSLSYDHRAVNGADGARFTTMLNTLLSDIRNMLL